MREIAKRTAGLPTNFKPGEPKKADAKADAVIEYAKKVRDWPLLLEAVEQKMDELEELVRWWKENVRRKGGPMDTSDNSERNYRYSVEEAERLTGFTQVQISRIGKRLKDRNAFRLALFGAAYAKASATHTGQMRARMKPFQARIPKPQYPCQYSQIYQMPYAQVPAT